jgi:hypothetical protein
MHCTSLHGHAACRAVPPMSRTVGRAAGPWAVWKYMPPAHGLFERVCVCESLGGVGARHHSPVVCLSCVTSRDGAGATIAAAIRPSLCLVAWATCWRHSACSFGWWLMAGVDLF